MRESRIRTSYVVTDYVATLIGVVIFSVLRYHAVMDIPMRYGGLLPFMFSYGVILTLLLFPPFMLLMGYLSGYYVRVYNKSRITGLVKTFVSAIVGTVAFFLGVLLNDALPARMPNYEIMLMFGCILFVCMYIGRVSVTTHYLRLIQSHDGARCGVLVMDMCDVAEKRVATMVAIGRQHGIRITTVADIDGAMHDGKLCGLPVIAVNDIPKLREHGDVSCVMLSDDTLSADRALAVIHGMFSFGMPVYVSPDMKALIMGGVRYESVLAEPLVDITRSELSDSFVAVKRFMDIVLSAVGLLVSLPVMTVLGILIRRQSSGPVIYSQERIGYRKRPFRLYKLRSMYEHSEPDGPMLASPDDARITPVGRVMRKYRLDELPNLWNVFIGDMSIVGPRPERQFYIDRIVSRAPHYTLVHQVRPGLTSWGMVKYGYACDVDGMVERLKYDMLYLQNMSLSLDIRILYYTLFTVIRGEGK